METEKGGVMEWMAKNKVLLAVIIIVIVILIWLSGLTAKEFFDSSAEARKLINAARRADPNITIMRRERMVAAKQPQYNPKVFESFTEENPKLVKMLWGSK